MNNNLNGWIKQIDKAYNGQILNCPNCNSKNTNYTFSAFRSGVGYADFVCEECGEHTHISRMKFPDGVKVKIIE